MTFWFCAGYPKAKEDAVTLLMQSISNETRFSGKCLPEGQERFFDALFGIDGSKQTTATAHSFEIKHMVCV
jgi:hypothetical protein